MPLPITTSFGFSGCCECGSCEDSVRGTTAAQARIRASRDTGPLPRRRTPPGPRSPALRPRRRCRSASPTRTRWPGSVPDSITAAGVSGDIPLSPSRAAIFATCRTRHVEHHPGQPCERVPVERAVGRVGVVVAGDERDRLAGVAVRERDAGRGTRPDRGRDTRERSRTARRLRARTSASSPPRPNTHGSPHFSRQTDLPSRANRTSASLIVSCLVEPTQ